MEKKQIAWYLIFGGIAIFILSFVTTILSFISSHPFLGFACILIGVGIFLLSYAE
jgi:undecaprenyl pyrophosphate phosphatase UppP